VGHCPRPAWITTKSRTFPVGEPHSPILKIRIRAIFSAIVAHFLHWSELKELVMRRPTVLLKAFASAAAILILAAGCSGQNPVAPSQADAGGPRLGIYATVAE
jgi:hypothetical protein